jgi:hypothetical protein
MLMSSPTAPVPDRPARAEERRTAVRHACAVPVRYRSRPRWLLGSASPAVLCNASIRGICLQTPRPEEVGRVLVVEVDKLPGASPRLLKAQVLHASRTPVLRDWVLGCALQGDELSEEDLRCLME